MGYSVWSILETYASSLIRHISVKIESIFEVSIFNTVTEADTAKSSYST